MIKIDLLKNNAGNIPVFARILDAMLGNLWQPAVQLSEVESWLYEWLNDSIPMAYVALENSIPVGICSLQLNDDIHSDLSPWLGDLCVAKDYQRRGIGKLLIAAVKNKAKEQGFSKLYLFSHANTVTNYYMRLGWQETEASNYRGHPGIIMGIEL